MTKSHHGGRLTAPGVPYDVPWCLMSSLMTWKGERIAWQQSLSRRLSCIHVQGPEKTVENIKET